MDGRHIQVARRKLSALREYLDGLGHLLEIPQSEFDGDPRNRLATERLIQVIVECAIDCNGLLILDRGQKPAPDYKGTFRLVADLGLVPADLTARLVAHVSTRNRIVHDYDRPTTVEVHNSATAVAKDFRAYLETISPFVVDEGET
jgi:uncharacterized protein YutE (UPF0331/DUF86 family)